MMKNIDVYPYARAFILIIKSDLNQVSQTVLNNLAESICILSYYFKTEIMIQVQELEKFSLKEAASEPYVEKYAL